VKIGDRRSTAGARGARPNIRIL